jgi:hypothetical protein
VNAYSPIGNMVRRAVKADFPAMVALGEKMHAAGKFAFLPYSPTKCRALLERLDGSAPHALLLVAEAATAGGQRRIIGMSIMVASDYFFCDGPILAHDLLLWVEPGERGSAAADDMMGQIVDWAAQLGCAEVKIGTWQGEATARSGAFLARARFERVGELYTRRLKTEGG